MKTVKYLAYGTLPEPWEDFTTDEKDLPYFTILAYDEENKKMIEYSVEECEDGWIDISIPDNEVTKEIAVQEILGYLIRNGYDYDRVEIIEEGIAQSI
jgi:hypothetical protein